jgi:hypothetical protein
MQIIKKHKFISSILLLIFLAACYFLYPQTKLIYTSYIVSKLPTEIHDKIWVHRVNSIGKAKQAEKIFTGLELDVTFQEESNTFDVNHPPAISQNLSLQQYLSSINAHSLSFWLDLKNFRGTYNEKALDRLITITDTLQIQRNRIIIESTYAHILEIYSDAGFKTSYYLPHRLLKSLTDPSRKPLNRSEKKSLNRLNRRIKEGSFHFISFHSKYLNFALENLDTSKDILLWNQKLELCMPSEKKEILSILERDNRIKVILVKLDSHKSR